MSCGRANNILLLFLLLCTGGATADQTQLPERFRAVYSLSQGGVTLARLEREGHRAEDGSYVIESEARPVGLAAWILRATSRERSQWRLEGDRVVPLRYFYEETGGREKSMDLFFDWEKGIAIDHRSHRRWELPEDAQDQTSIQFAIMAALRQGKERFHFSLLDGKRIKSHHYRVLARKRLDTALGRLEVVEVKEIRPPGRRHSIFWCSPRHAYLPMRIEQRKRGTIPLITVIEELKGFPRQELARVNR